LCISGRTYRVPQRPSVNAAEWRTYANYVPGEKINTVNAARPYSNFEVFESAVLRNFSSGTGLSPQQVTQDWSDVNYSSARSSLLRHGKHSLAGAMILLLGFAQPILTAFVEEVHDNEDLPLPTNAPDFVDARAAYSRARWMGPGRGWVDPVAEKKGAILGLDAGLSTRN
jgi:capsid protein